MKVIVALRKQLSTGLDLEIRVFYPESLKWEQYKKENFHNPSVEVVELEIE